MAGRSKAQWDNVGKLFPQYANGLDPDYVDRRLTENPEIMWRIIADVYDSYKRDEERARGEVKVGRRPKPDWVPMEELVAKVFPEPYTVEPFAQVLPELMGGLSQRAFAAKVPCNQSTLSRLLSGELEPDFAMLEAMAKAAGKQPYFFAEWRALYFGQLVAQSYLDDPRRSIGAMRAIRKRIETDRKTQRRGSLSGQTRSV